MTEPEGISVVEISLCLPNTCYYLEWPPVAASDRGQRLDALRGICRRLGWRILAAGAGSGGRLLFTTGSDPHAGLPELLAGAGAHRLYLVQPETALPRLACHIHHCEDVSRNRPPLATAQDPGLPPIHYGLFMGERDWARRMLELLTSCAAEPAESACEGGSLSEVAEHCSSTREVVVQAYKSGRFSLKDIAEHFDMHFSEVSAVINATPD